MSEDSEADTAVQPVLETMADPDCRAILETLDTAKSAKAVAEECGLAQTTAYRKLEALADAGLVETGTELRADGHHVTTYQRDVQGVMVLLAEDGGFDCEFVREPKQPDQRLAQFWSRMSEEL
ncbi:helix-turn-helix domain-containing protein [Halobaculum sp. D14]|uniref:helix-turn-helix domain-containing protein n=1 Tax=unclassified Halobaculum TaxID=2640896 RepID=UPI003EBE24D5